MDEKEEILGPGRVVKRGVDGKIIGGSLDSDTARAMGASRSKNKASQHQADINELLSEAGFDPEIAPGCFATFGLHCC
jgi:hypothetical protein